MERAGDPNHRPGRVDNDHVSLGSVLFDGKLPCNLDRSRLVPSACETFRSSATVEIGEIAAVSKEFRNRLADPILQTFGEHIESASAQLWRQDINLFHFSEKHPIRIAHTIDQAG